MNVHRSDVLVYIPRQIDKIGVRGKVLFLRGAWGQSGMPCGVFLQRSLERQWWSLLENRVIFIMVSECLLVPSARRLDLLASNVPCPLILPRPVL